MKVCICYGKELRIYLISNRKPRYHSNKESPASAGDTRDTGSISGSGRYPGEGNGNLLQYSCL